MKLNYFNFKKVNDKFLLTNDFGMYVYLNEKHFKKLLQKKIDTQSDVGKMLIDRKMIFTESELDFTSQNR